MTIRINHPDYRRSLRRFSRTHVVLSVAALGYLSGCSLKSDDYLSNGKSSGDGGGDTSQAGTAGENNQGGGGSAEAGSKPTGGKGGRGGATTGGSTNGGNASSGGASAVNSATSTGGTDTSACAVATTGGQLLTPPTQGFEIDALGDWSTVAVHNGALSRMSSDGTACEGTGYLAVNGALRTANWDGPTVNVLPYITIGHTYYYSIAARLSPSSSPTSAKTLGLVMALKCQDTSVKDEYAPITSVPVFLKWIRIAGTFTPKVLAGCSNMASILLYLESAESAAPYASMDLDDFKLTDITPPGTGGSSGTGGASSTGGSSSAGGTSSAGGASSTGGSKT